MRSITLITANSDSTFQDEENVCADLQTRTYNMVASQRKKPNHPNSNEGNIFKENYTQPPIINPPN
jgi:hypothetical protein